MAMKPKGTSALAPKTSPRPKDAFDSRMKKTLERGEGAKKREQYDYETRTMPSKTTSSTGAVTRSPRPKPRTK